AGRGRNEDAPPTQPVRAAAQHLALAHTRDGTGGKLPDPAQRGHRRPAAEAVRRQSDIALELGDRDRRLLAEDAVLTTGVEPERVQLTLELGDVVATQHGLAEVQGAVAEREAALDHGRPRLGAAHPVDVEAALLLKGSHRSVGRSTELARLVRRGVVTERDE